MSALEATVDVLRVENVALRSVVNRLIDGWRADLRGYMWMPATFSSELPEPMTISERAILTLLRQGQ